MNLFKISAVASLLIAATTSNAQQKFDGQAHRGGRGLMPENTIPAMKSALDFGATLEMDLNLSKDDILMVSHDDRISAVFALNTDGTPVTKEQAKTYQLNKLTAGQIEQFDIGSRPHPQFPRQKKMVAHIPQFSVLVDSVEAYAKAKN
jgi:glycerophosphoryl diester phosphodiesterase